jgi:hypothetical protein
MWKHENLVAIYYLVKKTVTSKYVQHDPILVEVHMCIQCIFLCVDVCIPKY